MAAPCLPHRSAISELMKRAKSVISRPSLQPLTAFSGERDRPGLIAGARAHFPRVLQNASLKSGFAARGIQLLQWSDVAAATTPTCRHRPPRARSSLCADAWLPRPRTAQPNLNPSDTTPIPTEYKASN